MHVIEARNVNDAYAQGLDLLLRRGNSAASRAGSVLVMDTPVMTIYRRPTERVLFDARRDANPFFHLAEAMWMLAGRNDVKLLDNYVHDFGVRFGEEDGTEHDAYGQRWREHFGFDQLKEIARRLSINRGDRQCVLQMWDATFNVDYDVVVGADDLRGNWKTRPCNTHCYFRAQEDGTLDMTLLCRSNDIIYGAYGANAVHFSFMQQYVAALAGLMVGKLYQFSNNFHAYEEVLDKLHLRDAPPVPVSGYPGYTAFVTDTMTFDDEIRHALNLIDIGGLDNPLRPDTVSYRNKFLYQTFLPMMQAHRQFKLGHPALALSIQSSVVSLDWRIAGRDWLARRIKADATVEVA